VREPDGRLADRGPPAAVEDQRERRLAVAGTGPVANLDKLDPLVAALGAPHEEHAADVWREPGARQCTEPQTGGSCLRRGDRGQAGAEATARARAHRSSCARVKPRTW
jgi:hypothetical protein